MYKDWAVTFWAKETGRVDVTIFRERTQGEAACSFRACYRHETYTILSVVEVPRM